MDWPDALLSLGIALVFVVPVLLIVVRSPHRKNARLVTFARRRRWSYQAEDIGSADRFLGAPFGRLRTNTHIRDILSGTHRERDFACFEYRRQGKAGEDRFRVIAVRTPATRPILQVVRRPLAVTLLPTPGTEVFELGAGPFDQHFVVETGNESFAWDILIPPFVHLLMADPRTHHMAFRFERDELVVWYQLGRPGPTIDAALDFACDLLARVPSPIWA